MVKFIKEINKKINEVRFIRRICLFLQKATLGRQHLY